MDDDLKADVVGWFHKHIEDGVYSEALYELLNLVDRCIIEGDTTLDAVQYDLEQADAKCEALEVREKDFETNLEAVSEMADEVEEKLDELRDFIADTLKKDTKK